MWEDWAPFRGEAGPPLRDGMNYLPGRPLPVVWLRYYMRYIDYWLPILLSVPRPQNYHTIVSFINEIARFLAANGWPIRRIDPARPWTAEQAIQSGQLGVEGFNTSPVHPAIQESVSVGFGELDQVPVAVDANGTPMPYPPGGVPTATPALGAAVPSTPAIFEAEVLGTLKPQMTEGSVEHGEYSYSEMTSLTDWGQFLPATGKVPHAWGPQLIKPSLGSGALTTAPRPVEGTVKPAKPPYFDPINAEFSMLPGGTLLPGGKQIYLWGPPITDPGRLLTGPGPKLLPGPDLPWNDVLPFGPVARPPRDISGTLNLIREILVGMNFDYPPSLQQFQAIMAENGVVVSPDRLIEAYNQLYGQQVTVPETPPPAQGDILSFPAQEALESPSSAPVDPNAPATIPMRPQRPTGPLSIPTLAEFTEAMVGTGINMTAEEILHLYNLTYFQGNIGQLPADVGWPGQMLPYKSADLFGPLTGAEPTKVVDVFGPWGGNKPLPPWRPPQYPAPQGNFPQPFDPLVVGELGYYGPSLDWPLSEGGIRMPGTLDNVTAPPQDWGMPENAAFAQTENFADDVIRQYITPPPDRPQVPYVAENGVVVFPEGTGPIVRDPLIEQLFANQAIEAFLAGAGAEGGQSGLINVWRPSPSGQVGAPLSPPTMFGTPQNPQMPQSPPSRAPTPLEGAGFDYYEPSARPPQGQQLVPEEAAPGGFTIEYAPDYLRPPQQTRPPIQGQGALPGQQPAVVWRPPPEAPAPSAPRPPQIAGSPPGQQLVAPQSAPKPPADFVVDAAGNATVNSPRPQAQPGPQGPSGPSRPQPWGEGPMPSGWPTAGPGGPPMPTLAQVFAEAQANVGRPLTWAEQSAIQQIYDYVQSTGRMPPPDWRPPAPGGGGTSQGAGRPPAGGRPGAVQPGVPLLEGQPGRPSSQLPGRIWGAVNNALIGFGVIQGVTPFPIHIPVLDEASTIAMGAPLIAIDLIDNRPPPRPWGQGMPILPQGFEAYLQNPGLMAVYNQNPGAFFLAPQITQALLNNPQLVQELIRYYESASQSPGNVNRPRDTQLLMALLLWVSNIQRPLEQGRPIRVQPGDFSRGFGGEFPAPVRNVPQLIASLQQIAQQYLQQPIAGQGRGDYDVGAEAKSGGGGGGGMARPLSYPQGGNCHCECNHDVVLVAPAGVERPWDWPDEPLQGWWPEGALPAAPPPPPSPPPPPPLSPPPVAISPPPVAVSPPPPPPPVAVSPPVLEAPPPVPDLPQDPKA